MPGRSYSATNGYRYGFNGKENDNEVKGEGNQQDYGMRIYDPRLGRFLSVDPLQASYSWYTPYQFAGNMPVMSIDIDGLEPSNSPNENENQAPTIPCNLYDKDEENKAYQRSEEHKRLTDKWKLISTEQLSKIQGKLVFSRESSLNDGTNYWWYNSKTREWVPFSPPVYTYPVDENPLKTIFWDATIRPLLPIKDVDIYISGNLKQKTNLEDLYPKLKGASLTVVWAGVQGGITSKDETGFYGNVVTGDVSYLSYKKGGTEIRALPFKGLGVSITQNGAKYGEYSPTLRILTDTKLRFYGVPLQTEVGMSTATRPTIGLRGKLETPSFWGWSAEAVGGIRLDLKVPDVISAIFK